METLQYVWTLTLLLSPPSSSSLHCDIKPHFSNPPNERIWGQSLVPPLKIGGREGGGYSDESEKENTSRLKKTKNKTCRLERKAGGGNGTKPKSIQTSLRLFIFIHLQFNSFCLIYLFGFFFCELKIWNMSCMANCDISLATHSCRVVQ